MYRRTHLTPFLLGLFLWPLLWSVFFSSIAHADKSGVEPSRVKLPKGPGSLEGLGEDAKVEGNMGVMGYSVPIAMPESYDGWAPSLSLQYSSSGGMEEIGMGWSLSLGGAPSHICRMTSRGLPRYTAEDGFIAGSDELVQVGEIEDAGEVRRIYRKRFVQAQPEGDGLSSAGTRYEWISDARAEGDSGAHGYWKVEHPDSTVSYYGSNPLGRIFEESRIETSRGTFCYGLTERQDAWGHWIRYGYEKDRDEFDERRSGRPYLVRISWHPNREDRVDEGVGTRYSAELVYEERPDILTDGKPGALVRTDERLSEVLVYVASVGEDREVLRKHDLIYHDEWEAMNGRRGGILDVKRSLLYEVRTYGAGGEEEFSTIYRFSYTDGMDAVALDRTGQDRIWSNQGTVHSLTTAQGLEESDGRLGAAVDFRTGLADLVDINGDSLPDIVYTPRQGAHQLFIQEGVEYGGAERMYQFASAHVSETSGRASALLSSESVYMADLDGNGKSDLFDQANGRILWNDGEGDWAAPEEVGSDFLPDMDSDADLKLLDIDYDRKIDAFHLSEGAAWYRKNPGNGQLEEFEWVDGVENIDIPNVSFSDDRLELSDMNGDGMVDLVAPLRAGEVAYYANLGWGRFSSVIRMDGLPEDRDGQALDLKYIDINGDGLSDAVSVGADRIRYALNQNGERFISMRTILRQKDGGDLPERMDTTSIRYADMNGSGSTDIVYITSSGLIEYVELFETAPNLLRQIENGIGKNIRVTYQNTTQMRLEMQGEEAVGEEASSPSELPHPMTVVKSISIWDVHSRITDTTHYSYQGGYYDHQEHQFRGFRNVSIRQEGSAVDSPFSETIEEAFTQEQYDVGEEDRYRKGLLLSSSLKSGGEPISRSENMYDDCILASILKREEEEVMRQDGTVPRAGFICQTQTETTLQERKAEPEWVRTASEYMFDGFGREVETSRFGVTSIGGGACAPCNEGNSGDTGDPLHHKGAACGPSCLGDEEATRTLWITPGPDRNKTGGHWNLGLVYQKERMSLPEDVLRESGQNTQPMKLVEKYYYDGEAHVGLPHQFAFRGVLSRKTIEGEGSFRSHSISPAMNGAAIATERFGYDAHGQVISSVDANGNQRSFSYNEHLLEAEVLHLEDYNLRMQIGAYHPLFDKPTSIVRWQVIEGGEATSRAHTSHYGYDSFGRIISIEHPDDAGLDGEGAPSQVFEYDIRAPLSRLISKTSTEGDGNYNLEKVQCFDARGRAILEKSKLSEEGGTSVYQVSGFTQYGRQGRAIRGYQPYQASFSGCEEAPPVETRYTSTSYDGTGRVLQITHPDAAVYGSASTEKKVYGPLTEEIWDRNDTDAEHASYGTPTIVYQDGLGRTVKQKRLASNEGGSGAIEARFFYDGLGRLAGLTGPEGHTQWQVTDALGRVTLAEDPNRGESRMRYDAAGNLLESTDSRGETTAYRYDAANRLIAQWHQNEGENPLLIPSHGEGRDLITWTYDKPREGSGCVEDEVLEGAGCGNEAGALSSVEYDLKDTETGKEHLRYDARGRAAFTTYERRGERFTIRTQYDHADRIREEHYPVDISVRYEYDGGGRLVSIPGLLESQRYKKEGMLHSRTYPSGISELYGYDEKLELRSQVIGQDNSSPLHHLAYTRDRKGQITEVEDLRSEVSRDTTLFSENARYQYDALDRLIKTNIDVDREKAEELTYRYSPSGRVLEKASSLRERSAAHLGTYGYSSRLHPHTPTQAGIWSLSYDRSGNLTEQSVANGNYSLSHGYNHLGQLVESTRSSGSHPVTSYSYNADGERAVKREKGRRVDYLSPNLEIRDGIVTVYVKDPGSSSTGGILAKLESSRLSAELLKDHAPLEQNNNVLRTVPDNQITAADAWVFDAEEKNILIIEEDDPAREASLQETQKVSAEELLAASVQRLLLKHGAEEEDAVRKTFYHNNHLGSTALTTDENGEVLTRVHYYPYGTIRRTAAELPTYNFTGKERDQTTGLSYHSARYLSPTFAAWTQPDPLFHTLSDKSIELPWQASNPYGYGLGNPIYFTDPFGTESVEESIARTQKMIWGGDPAQHTYRVIENLETIFNDNIKGRFVPYTGVKDNLMENVRNTGSSMLNLLSEVPAVAGTIKTVKYGYSVVKGFTKRAGKGIVAKDGTKITGYTKHGIERAIGDGGKRAGVKPQSTLDTLKNPKKISDSVDQLGRPSRTFTGESSRIVVNPDTGKIISTNPLSGKGAK